MTPPPSLHGHHHPRLKRRRFTAWLQPRRTTSWRSWLGTGQTRMMISSCFLACCHSFRCGRVPQPLNQAGAAPSRHSHCAWLTILRCRAVTLQRLTESAALALTFITDYGAVQGTPQQGQRCGGGERLGEPGAPPSNAIAVAAVHRRTLIHEAVGVLMEEVVALSKRVSTADVRRRAILSSLLEAIVASGLHVKCGVLRAVNAFMHRTQTFVSTSTHGADGFDSSSNLIAVEDSDSDGTCGDGGEESKGNLGPARLAFQHSTTSHEVLWQLCGMPCLSSQLR